MNVETYELPEVDHQGTRECEQEAIDLIEQLDLVGQRKLVTPDESGESRCPYRKMTKEEKFAFEHICPKKSKLREYSDGMIPLRVLQVASHAKDLFDELRVWHPENADEPDPVLVGVNGSYQSAEYFLLARWGDVLERFDVLLDRAVERYRRKRRASLLDIARRAGRLADDVETMPMEDCMKTTDPSFYP